MKKNILISLILCLSAYSFAQVPPSPLKNCTTGVKGVVTGLYAENWDKKAAIKIGDNFYYISNSTNDGYARVTYATAMAAYSAGATVTIMECQGDHIDSIQVD